MSDEFYLAEGEKMHPIWLRLKAHWTARLADLRLRNDDPSATEAQTAALRGHIACLKSIIALGDDRPVIGDNFPPERF